MANEFLEVVVNSNGTIQLHDLEHGFRYEPLLVLEDCADIGDGWYHGVAVNDEVVTSTGSNAAISRVCHGPEKTTLRIETDFVVPSRFDFDRMRRSPERETVRVIHLVTLRKGVRRVEVETVVENTVRDHRLRVLFTSSVRTDRYRSDSPFDTVERPISLRKDNFRYKELEVETKPVYTWTAVASSPENRDSGSGAPSRGLPSPEKGLAVVSTGLPESAVLDNPDREIALTLLRSFRKAVFTDGNEGGQIRGTHRFRYNIVPFAGEIDPLRLGREGQILAAGLRTVQASPEDPKRDGSPHPDPFSLLEVEGGVLVTSVRGVREKDLLVRFYNPNEEPRDAVLRVAGGFQKASLCNLLDQPLEELSLEDGKVCVKVDPKKIMTLCLESR